MRIDQTASSAANSGGHRSAVNFDSSARPSSAPAHSASRQLCDPRLLQKKNVAPNAKTVSAMSGVMRRVWARRLGLKA